MKCMNVMQCKSYKTKQTKNQRKNVTKSTALKHKDHVRNTQLD